MNDWLVFDLDETLIDRERKFLPEAKQVLDTAREKGIPMFVASYNDKAPDILKTLGVFHYFRGIEYGKTRKKFDMIKTIAQRENLHIFHAVFFDDRKDNCRDCTQEGILSIPVQPQTGVTLYNLQYILNTMHSKVLVVGLENVEFLPILQNVFNKFRVRVSSTTTFPHPGNVNFIFVNVLEFTNINRETHYLVTGYEIGSGKTAFSKSATFPADMVYDSSRIAGTRYSIDMLIVMAIELCICQLGV